MNAEKNRKAIIDHDEDDRESSEYEDIDDVDEMIVSDNVDGTIPVEDNIPVDDHSMIQMGEYIDYSEYGVVEHEQIVNGDENGYYENDQEIVEQLIGSDIPSTSHGKEQNGEQVAAQYSREDLSSPACIVCGRMESEKIRLFRWPKNENLREQWIHFFRLRSDIFNVNNDPFICCFHFTADTFIMVGNRIYWKASAIPKYRVRRPCNTEPFPWESEAKNKLQEQREMAEANAIQYKIRYRMPYNKHKSRNSHPVAVLSPVNQPHLFYEFHYNRTSPNNTKFYACLNCRKAKAESGIRDVIRTIHLDNCKLLSQHDPFSGHHFACRPHNVYDYSSTWRSLPSKQNEQRFVEDVVYVDENGEPIQWEHCERSQITDEQIEYTAVNEVIEKPNNVHINDGEMYQESTMVEPPNIGEPFYSEEITATVDETSKTRRIGKRPKIKQMKCHLCISQPFLTTKTFVQHLQSHIDSETNCSKCDQRISCDEAAFFKRRSTCRRCYSHESGPINP